MGYHFRWDLVIRQVPAFLMGLKVTGIVAIASMTGAIVGGLLLSLCRTGGAKGLNLAARGYVELVRNTPLLIQMFLIYFGLPQIGIMLEPSVSIVLALALHYSAYLGEIFRANIEAIPRAQREGGMALGMSAVQIMRRVILPQAIRRSLPAMSNQLVYLTKDTSLAAFFGMKDVMFAAIRLQVDYWRVFEAYITVGAIYLVISIIVTILSAQLERRWVVS